MASIVLLDLLGGVALLLWGLHMVQSGVIRAYGSDLRRFLSTTLRNRFLALLAGAAVTALLQSSTATGLITSSFAAQGAIDLVPALAIMLGANVGTTLIVQILAFNVAAFAPVLFIVGIIAFKRGRHTRTRDLGRVAIGAGLVLLALHVLIDTLAPAEQAPAVRTVLSLVTQDPILCVLVAALLAWLAHSSVAVVLLVMSLGYSHFIDPSAITAMVVGANLGSAINPILEAGHSTNPASLRLPVGNFLNRLIGCVGALFFLQPLTAVFLRLDPSAAHMAADFHLAFNLALAVLFVPLLDILASLLRRFLPERGKSADPAAVQYLDEAALGTPSIALACAARETLHMGDIVETMLEKSITALMTDDRKLVAEISRMDNALDRLEEAVKLYITKLTRESLSEREGRRAMEIISFAINLEHIGDIIDKNLMELAAKKIKRRLAFSREGAAELAAFHRGVLDSLKVAFGVFLSEDLETARRLVARKSDMHLTELSTAENHLARLREGRTDSIESSSLHLDILRDLKRIHSHICTVAYPILNLHGEGEPSLGLSVGVGTSLSAAHD